MPPPPSAPPPAFPAPAKPSRAAPAAAPATRTVLGAFRTTAELDRALARLAALRPPAIVDLDAVDAVVLRWLAGAAPAASSDIHPHPARGLIVRLAGAARDVALGYRQVWQAVETADGVPSAVDAPARGLGDHPSADAGVATRVHVRLPEDALTALLDWAAEVGAVVGGAGARVRPGHAEGWVYVPAGPGSETALAWLRGQVHGRGGRMTVDAAAAAGSKGAAEPRAVTGEVGA